MLDRLAHLDRRFIFFFIAVALVIGLLGNVDLPIKVTPPVQKAFDTLDRIPEGSRVIISFDYGPSSMLEIGPATDALLKHCFKKNLKVVGIALWPDGELIGAGAMKRIGEEMGKKEEIDWVFLGYKYGGPTGSGVIEPMGTDFFRVFPNTRAAEGKPSRPSNQVPVLEGVKNYADFKALVTLSAGVPGIKEYVQMANSRYNVTVTGAAAKVTMPELTPFLDSGQLSGVLGGVIAGAEYEKLVGKPGLGHKFAFTQSVVHLLILALILLGNLMFFLSRRGG